MKYVIDSKVYENHINDEVHLYGLLHQLAFLAEKAKDEKDLENLAETSKRYGEIAEEKFDDWLISGSAFRMLVGDLFDLLAQYGYLRNRVLEVKTERQLAQLQKNLSGEHPAIRRMYRRWGITGSTGITGFDMLESAIRRTHLTPYDPDGSEDDYD